MDKCTVNIALIEPSAIVSEGLSAMLSQSGNEFQVYRFEGLDEALNDLKNYKFNLFIINPSVITDNLKVFLQEKNKHPNITWIGILYSLYQRNILDLLDNTIHITDSVENITGIINKLATDTNPYAGCAEQEQLTLREAEVLRYLSLGLSNKEIADKLFISIHTVISHRKSIVHKTGIKSQAGLTIYAITNKMIRIEDFQV